MNQRWLRLFALIFLAWNTAYGSHAETEALRPWTISDSIAVRYFSTVQTGMGPQYWEPGQGNAVVPSPDGRYFFFLSHHGDLASDSNIFTLEVFEVATIKSFMTSPGERPKPLRIVTFKSRANAPAISDARWEDDGKGIGFVATTDAGKKGAFLIDIATGTLNLVSAADHDVVQMRSNFNGSLFIYQSIIAPRPSRTLLDDFTEYPTTLVKRDELHFRSQEDRTEALFISDRGGHARQAAILAGRYAGVISHLSIAPDGSKAIVIASTKDSPIPESWNAYGSGRDGDEYSDTVKFQRFLFVDIASARMQPAFDAPTGLATTIGKSAKIAPTALWSADSRYVALVNTALPLDGSEERKQRAYLAIYEVKTGHWYVIEDLHGSIAGKPAQVSAVGWQGHNQLLVTHQVNGLATEGTVYKSNGNRWVGHGVSASVQLPRPVEPRLGSGLSVQIRESANDPPMMVASLGAREVNLTEPDPALQGVSLAHAETVEWTEGSRGVKGLLILPTKRLDGTPPPLIIQAHTTGGYLPNYFLPDGDAPTAFAARPLVSQGFAVLQFDTRDPDTTGMPFGAFFVKRVDAAVKALADRGLIDAKHVGLVGWSHGSELIYYAVTHPGAITPVAAVCGDGWDGSYMSYVADAVTSMFSEAGERDAALRGIGKQIAGGTGFFWDDKMGWLEHATDFNADRIKSPVLFTSSGGPLDDTLSLASLLQTMGTFQLNHRPFEYIVFPQGWHGLIRPRERQASMEATLDWLRFWLQGEKDGAPGKVPQYTRWQKLVDQQKAVNAALAARGESVIPLPSFNPTNSMPPGRSAP
jgi:dipeptidyl aminopeptidase/acylaminoacyl peptidase